MGHGKETPRQKMIGMMYLVLTAMLAMNVSASVLDAFVLVEDGLTQTAKNFKIETNSAYNELFEAKEFNAKKALKWYNKAQLVKQETKNLQDYIDSLKIAVVKSGDGENTEAIVDNVIYPEKIKAKGNLEAGSQMFIGPTNNGEAQVLKKRLNSYKQFLLDQIEDVDKSSYEHLISTISQNLSTELPETKGVAATKPKSWERARFEEIPLIAVLPQLTSMQVNIINSESEILSYLLGQIDAGSFSFNVITSNVQEESDYVIKGNKYSATISMAAYDSTQSPRIMIGRYDESLDNEGNTVYTMIGKEGVNYKVLDVENGRAKYEVPATKIGTNNYSGLIGIMRPDGTYMYRPINGSFEVAEPNVVVSPEKMNVFYRGVDNPVSVSVAGVPEGNVEATVSSGAPPRKVGSTYIIKPGKGSTCKVSVYARIDGKRQLIDTKNFRVKPVPDPFASVRGVKGKKVSRMDLVRSKGIAVKMPEWFDFDLRFSVISFKIATVRGGMINELSNRGANFSQQQKNLIKGIKRGGKLFVENIKVKGPDGETREINDIVLTVN